MTAQELKVLRQGYLGKQLKAWEETHKTRLQDTMVWFEGNILEPRQENRKLVASLF